MNGLITKARGGQNLKYLFKSNNEKNKTQKYLDIYKTALQTVSFLNLNQDNAHQQTNVVEIENASARNVMIEINVEQEKRLFDMYRIDITNLSSNVTKLVEHFVEKFMDTFKNSQIRKSDYQNVNLAKSNLLTALLRPAQLHNDTANIGQIIDSNTDVSNAFVAEKTKILNDEAVTQLKTQLNVKICNLSNQRTHMRVKNVYSEDNLKINVKTKQTLEKLISILIDLRILHTIGRVIDRSDSFELDSSFLNELDEQHNFLKKSENVHATLGDLADSLGNLAFYLAILGVVVLLIYLAFKFFK